MASALSVSLFISLPIPFHVPVFQMLHFIAFRRMIIFNYNKGAGLSEKGDD